VLGVGGHVALGELAAPAVVLYLAREGGKVDASGLVAAAELFILFFGTREGTIFLHIKI
jgi:hypothetical protein